MSYEDFCTDADLARNDEINNFNPADPFYPCKFMGIEAGDRVTFRMYAGRGLKGPEYKPKTAMVNPLLIFEDHVVVNHGAMGQVVNTTNYISHKPAAK